MGARQGHGAVRVEERLHLAIPTGAYCQVAFRPDGRGLAVATGLLAGRPAQLRLVDLPSGKDLRTLTTTQKGLVAVAFSPDGKRVAAVGGGQSFSAADKDQKWMVEVWGVASDQGGLLLHSFNRLCVRHTSLRRERSSCVFVLFAP